MRYDGAQVREYATLTTAQDNNAKPRGGRFAAGNPGKPKGARHRVTRAAEEMLDGEAEALTRKAIDLALCGDPMALRLCLERILPPRKERPVDIVLPVLTGPKDAMAVSAALLAAVAAGEIAPGEASVVGRLVELHLRAVEAHDLEARLAALEARQQ